MRRLILLTNDDGILSPGLRAAAEAVADLGELLIVAPRYQQTGMSRSMPHTPKTGVIEELLLPVNGSSQIAYGVHGSPAQAVRHAVLELAPRKPDLCISGINYGENLGASITISGTIGAAIEAGVLEIPGLAVSTETESSAHHSETYGEVNWDVAAHFTRRFAESILERGLPPEIALLNLNVPGTATFETTTRVTVQSRYSYFVPHAEKGRDLSASYHLPYSVNRTPDKVEPNSDIYAYAVERVVTVTPLGIDLTAKVRLEEWYRDFS